MRVSTLESQSDSNPNITHCDVLVFHIIILHCKGDDVRQLIVTDRLEVHAVLWLCHCRAAETADCLASI